MNATLAAAATTLGMSRFEEISERILYACVDFGMLMIGVGILMCLYRIVRGPTLIDRGVAADTVAFQVVGLVVLITVRFSTLVDFDAVLIVSILGFVSTVAFAQFIGRRGTAQ